MDTARRRLQVIESHVLESRSKSPSEGNEEQFEQQQLLALQPTAGEVYVSDGYSVILPEKLKTGEWNVYRSARYPLQLVEKFEDYPEVRTLHDNLANSARVYEDCKYLGARVRREDGSAGEYKWMTYGEVGAARSAIGSALVKHGIPKGSCVGLYMINRPEWVIVEQACNSYSYVSVPLYDTLGADAVQYIINHAEINAVFCTQDKLQTILSCLSELPTIRLIGVIVDERNALPLPSISGVEILSFRSLEAEGIAHPSPFVPPAPEDTATLCYTSGTTGTPKGVVLTHRNLITSCAGYTRGQQVSTNDVHVSYLPLAHIYERMNVITACHYGCGVGFYQGDVLKLLEDLEALKPTMFSSVPRLYNRIYDRINSTVKGSSGLKQWIFNAAYNAKKEALARGKTPSPIWDRLVFNKIKSTLGGRTRILASGASPISPEVLDFLRICFGCQVTEGYGMTETSCVITNCDKEDLTSGHVGSPNPACEVKLVDVPEMEYTSRDKPYPRGEICVRGPIIFQGYYKDEVQTREVLDDEGWLHTGDIGLWLPGGRLKIIDRKKNIFKLAQGEYIAPEKIENVYVRSQFIAQIFVYGDSFNANLVAIAVVDPDVLPGWAKAKGFKHYDDLEKLCRDPQVKEAVLNDMNEMARTAQLRGFEFAKAVTLIPEAFSVENGLLTPSLKVKRPTAKARFAQAISDMYAELAVKETLPQTKSSL
ncbi:hypothetical protein R1flu_028433 [Riccia fluitans]|uniref:Long-chain-fatty-acid--CoA ligase n=1 Tax=Riccia fluitans TaxID=41844 RepID=A0ABD1XLP0_9MARC